MVTLTRDVTRLPFTSTSTTMAEWACSSNDALQLSLGTQDNSVIDNGAYLVGQSTLQRMLLRQQRTQESSSTLSSPTPSAYSRS
jgi:hypothetical protein